MEMQTTKIGEAEFEHDFSPKDPKEFRFQVERGKMLRMVNSSQKAEVRFVAADMPEAHEMVVGMMALVAQAQRRMISDRTKAAPAADKVRGQRLGNPKGHTIPANDATRARGSAANAAKAQASADRLQPVLLELGHLSAKATAGELTNRRFTAPGSEAARRGRGFPDGVFLSAFQRCQLPRRLILCCRNRQQERRGFSL
jgi:hypothetical protein